MAALVPFDNYNDYRTTAMKRVEGKDLSGKTIVLTGANGAIGVEMTHALCLAGATVIMAGRSMSKLEAAKTTIVERAKSSNEELKGTMECMVLDLADYDSVQSFVKGLKNRKIDILINNAGIVPGKEYKEKDGVELTFLSNFAATVVLTELMLPLMSDKGRIIHQSSMSHADATNPIQWDTIPSTKETFGGYNKDYAESKWLLTSYSSALNRRLVKSGNTVVSVCADPGASPDSPMWDQQSLLIRIMARYVFKFLTKSLSQAAACATNLAVMDDIEGGGYYYSGVIGDPLRDDTQDPNEWNKAAKILKEKLPEDLKHCAKEEEI